MGFCTESARRRAGAIVVVFVDVNTVGEAVPIRDGCQQCP